MCSGNDLDDIMGCSGDTAASTAETSSGDLAEMLAGSVAATACVPASPQEAPCREHPDVAVPEVPLPRKHGRKGPRGSYTCSACGALGHNARTCKMVEDSIVKL